MNEALERSRQEIKSRSKGNESGDDHTKEAQLRSMEQRRTEEMNGKGGEEPSKDEW